MEKIEINNYEFNGKIYNELYELLEDMSKNWEDAIEHINTPLLETALAECGEKSIYNKFMMSKTAFYEEVPKFLHIIDFMLKKRLEMADNAISAFRKKDEENELLINLLTSHGFKKMNHDNPEVITDMYAQYPQNVIDFTNEFKKAILSRRTSVLKAFVDICAKPKSIGSDLAYEVDNSEFDEKTKELGTDVLKKLIEIKNSIKDALQKVNDEEVAQAAKNKNPGQVTKITYAKIDISDSKLADIAAAVLDCDFIYYSVFKNPFFKINEEYHKVARELHLFYFLNSVVDNEVFSYKDICCQNINELKEYLFNNNEKLKHPKYKYIALFMLCYATTNKNIDDESKNAIINMWLSLDSKYHDFLSSEDIVIEKNNPTQNQENSSLKELELSNKEEIDETAQTVESISKEENNEDLQTIKPLSKEEIDRKYYSLVGNYVEILSPKKARHYSDEEYSQYLYNIEKINNLFWKLIYSSIYIYDGEQCKKMQIIQEREGESKDIIKSFLHNYSSYASQLCDKENENLVANPDKVKQFFKIHFKRRLDWQGKPIYDGEYYTDEDYHVSSYFCLEDQYYPFVFINGKDRLIINTKNIPFEIVQFYIFNKKSGEMTLDLTDINKAKELLKLLNEKLTFKPLKEGESGGDYIEAVIDSKYGKCDDYSIVTDCPMVIDYKPYKDEKPFEVFQRIIKEFVLRASTAVEIIKMKNSFLGRRKLNKGHYDIEREITKNSLKNLSIFIDAINNNKKD